MWIGTVAEAVFLIGAERNADKIFGAAYVRHSQTHYELFSLILAQAPLFQNLDSYQWAPDLISYSADTSSDVLSTSYHMIQLFSSHRISTTLPIDAPSFDPVYYVAGHSNSSDSYLLKAAVYNSTEPVPISVTFSGVAEGAEGTLTVLTAPDAESYSDVGTDVVKSTTTSLKAGSEGVFEYQLDNLSISVLEVKA